MNYREAIVEMLGGIQKTSYLKRIYELVLYLFKKDS